MDDIKNGLTAAAADEAVEVGEPVEGGGLSEVARLLIAFACSCVTIALQSRCNAVTLLLPPLRKRLSRALEAAESLTSAGIEAATVVFTCNKKCVSLKSMLGRTVLSHFFPLFIKSKLLAWYAQSGSYVPLNNSYLAK